MLLEAFHEERILRHQSGILLIQKRLLRFQILVRFEYTTCMGKEVSPEWHFHKLHTKDR